MKPYEWKYKWILLWNSSSLLLKSFCILLARFNWIGSKSATVHSAESGKVGKLPLEQKSSFLSLFFISFHYEIGFVIYHVLKRCAKKVFFSQSSTGPKKIELLGHVRDTSVRMFEIAPEKKFGQNLSLSKSAFCKNRNSIWPNWVSREMLNLLPSIKRVPSFY